jgi:Flp pilus assembly protein TadG
MKGNSGLDLREFPARCARGSKERGGSLVEQAFAIVLLLTIIFAIIDFGRALYTYHFVSNVAREATRWASVRGKTCIGLAGGCPANVSDVQTYVSAVSGMGLDSTKITTTPQWGPAPNNAPVCGGAASTTPTPTNSLPGCVVQVQVQYAYKFFFPFLPKSTVNMSSASEMVISQ